MASIPSNVENTEIFDFMKLGQDCERVAIRVYQTCQYGGRKSGGRDAEFQEKIRKE